MDNLRLRGRNSPVGPPRIAPEHGAKEPGRRAAEGLQGNIDTPATGETVGGDLYLAGWVYHPKREVSGVAIRANGRLVGAATTTIDRPDVAAHLGVADDTTLLGWSTTVELPASDASEITIEVFAVLAPRPAPAGEASRLGVSLPLHSIRVRAVDPAEIGGGPGGLDAPSAVIWEGQRLSIGYNRVQGLVDVPGEISRVEVSCDGAVAGPARTALPGHAFRADRQPSARIAAFEAGINVTHAGEVHIAGTVECVDGQRIEIDPITITVDEPKLTGPSPQRVEIVRQRVAERASQVAAPAATPGELAPVLILTHDLGLGGGQLWLHELLLRLHARGVPMALTAPRGGVLVDTMEDLGVPVLVTGTFEPHHPEAYEAQILLISQWAREHGCESAIANTMSAFAGVDATQRLGLPVAWAIHESFPLSQFWIEAFPPPVPTYAAERGRRALGLVDAAVFEAQATLDLYAPHLPPGVGDVVPYGVDFSDIDRYVSSTDRAALRERLGFDESTLVLLCVGTIEPRKAQINLAQAFLGSEEMADADVALVFVGAQAGSPYVAALKDYVDRLDDGGRVRIEPMQPDVYQWYHAADALLCASDVESLPRSMLEVMAFGTPVASTAVFGIPELLTDGDTGYLCEPRDLAELRRMLERTVATPRAELDAMGARAKALVLRRHDPVIYEDYFFDWLTAQAAEDMT